MNTSTAVKLIAGITAGVLVWQMYSGAKKSLQDLLQEIADMPGKALNAVADAAQSVVDGTSPISDPAGGGFVKEAAPARIVDYTHLRNIDPLIAYLISQGNTAAARSSAYAKGWTADEISLAVLAMAQHFGNQ